MMIIDALKELPLLEKRIEKNVQRIQEYSSYGTHVGPVFKKEGNDVVTEHLQAAEVASIIQANKDLIARYMKIRRVLNLTNSTVQVTIHHDGGDLSLTIAEWIAFRTKAHAMMKRTFQALNINQATAHVKGTPSDLATGVPIGIVRCFDEKYKNKEIDRLDEIFDKINATLEKVNATTELVEVI